MDASDIRTWISETLNWTVDKTGDPTGEMIDTVCSEGCQGLDQDPEAPGFVLQMKGIPSYRRGRRFHVTVRELP